MKKPSRKYDEVNYWESMADSMVALLLCILLIALLLILYLVRVQDNDFIDLEEGDSYEEYHDEEDGGGNHAYGEIDDEYGNDSGENDYRQNGENGSEGSGGGIGGSGSDDERYKYEDPDPGAGLGEGNDKAAVFVQVVDGETSRTIKKEGIEFELYGANSALQVLSTYYPDKIDFKKYETDETGVFYLPEKVALASYYLHQLTTINGYDTADNTAFSIEQSYDWDEPYVVTVALYPSKNIIRMQLNDVDSGEAVTGASFNVVAAEDIITKDGTTRYKAGDIVDAITVDKNGYGESEELYLGNYLLRQDKVPEYYGRITSDTVVEVESRAEAGNPGIKELTEDKTSVNVMVIDALYDTTYIAGAKFALSTDDGTIVENVMTDEKGRFTVTNLKKNTTYHIQQTASVSDYEMDNADHSFTVNGDGLIDGKTESDIRIKNRMIRILVGVKDKLFKGQISDVNAAVYDASGKLIKAWNTTGLEQTIEGLTPGEYRVVLDGNESQAQVIEVKDMTELQIYQFERWTAADIGAIFGLCLFGLGVVVLVIVLIRQRRQKKMEEKEQGTYGK